MKIFNQIFYIIEVLITNKYKKLKKQLPIIKIFVLNYKMNKLKQLRYY